MSSLSKVERARSTRSSATFDGGTTNTVPLTINKKSSADGPSPQIPKGLQGPGEYAQVPPPVPPKDNQSRLQSRSSLPGTSSQSPKSSGKDSFIPSRSSMDFQARSRSSVPTQITVHDSRQRSFQPASTDLPRNVLQKKRPSQLPPSVEKSSEQNTKQSESWYVKPGSRSPYKPPMTLSPTLVRSISARVASPTKRTAVDGEVQPHPNPHEVARAAAHFALTTNIRRANSLKEESVSRSSATTQRPARTNSNATLRLEKPLPPNPERPSHRHAESDSNINCIPVQPSESLHMLQNAPSDVRRQSRSTIESVYSQASAESESVLAKDPAQTSFRDRLTNQYSDPTTPSAVLTEKAPSEAGSEVTLKWRFRELGRRWSKYDSDHYTDSYCTSLGPRSPNAPTFEKRFCIESEKLDEVFPSLFKPYEMIRNLPQNDPGSLEVLIGLAKLFDNCLDSAIAILKDVTPQIQNTSGYQNALSGLKLSQSMFMTQVEYLASEENRESIATATVDLLVDADGHLDEIMRSLWTLLTVVRGIHDEDSPPQQTETEDLVDEAPMEDAGQRSLGEDKTRSLVSRPRSGLSYGATETNATRDHSHANDAFEVGTGSTTGTLRPVDIKKEDIVRPGSLSFTDLSTVISTEAGEVPSAPTFGWRSFAAPLLRLRKSRPYTPPAIRLSLYQFPDLYTLDGDTKDIHGIVFGDGGAVATATFSALVRVLTSTRELVDYDFTEVFFIAFRQFATPEQLYTELVRRYMVKTPTGLSDEEMTQWRRKARATRLRVVKALHSWTDLYWRQEVDHVVKMPLVKFVYERIAKDFGDSFKGVADNLYKAASAGPLHRGRQLRAKAAAAEARMDTSVQPIVPPVAEPDRGLLGGFFTKGTGSALRDSTLNPITQSSSLQNAVNTSRSAQSLGFGHSLRSPDTAGHSNVPQIVANVPLFAKIPKRLNIYQFNNARAIFQLAEQLTIWESKLYRAVDPYDFYLDSIGKPVHPEIKKAIQEPSKCSDILMDWVSETIKEAAKPASMAETFEVFAMLGKMCLSLRNFQTPMSIWGGLRRIHFHTEKYAQVLELLSPSGINDFTEIDKLYRNGHLPEYESRLLSEERPAVPYLGWSKAIIMGIHEQKDNVEGETYNGEPVINVIRLRAIAACIRDMEKFHVEYKLKSDETIQKYISDMLVRYRPKALIER
ncbi:ras GEF [Neolentinus lepideus HHB14362 ss-1]|uniref:Ras GEF n=1 Tax=Neolentinus lepideus HHB14362 ss-1 TaxID=1314782 RepID=A0A165SMV6_9AGAM|nr:ras GEF [Neolentinus lepideus HHB14362 ss-1]